MALKTQQPLVPLLDTRIAQPQPKIADEHYRTPEHKAWAKEVIRRAGYRCQNPACATPRQGQGRRLFADHRVELKDGGAPLDPNNGQALCATCHGNKTASAARLRAMR